MIRMPNQINLTPFSWVFSLDYSVHVDRKILKRFFISFSKLLYNRLLNGFILQRYYLINDFLLLIDNFFRDFSTISNS